MCGIAGIYAAEQASETLFNALIMLQHRGQDGAGIATINDGTIYMRRRNGLLNEVFNEPRHLEGLKGNMGIGHLRYPTAGGSSARECQPFYVNSPYGLALAHNGTLTNAEQLREELFVKEKRHINTGSDSEVLLNYLALYLQGCDSEKPDEIFAAMAKLFDKCRGAYSAVALMVDVGLLAFRDRYSIRPLILGSRTSLLGKEYMLASESAALIASNFVVERDLDAGEVIFIDTQGNLFSQNCAGKDACKTPCIFEYVYFARPDSVIDGISVHKSRQRMGRFLADSVKKEIKKGDIDVVIPVPDSSRVSAVELALELGINYREGLVKNRYIGRTFIMPRQDMRDVAVNRKLTAVDMEFKGKNILLVDDSIVRGTTCKQIIDLARRAGAKKVYFASAAPPVIYPNVYGIDMPSHSELVANGRDNQEVCDVIGSDGLVYQKLDNLIASVQEGNPKIKRFDVSIFNGEYITKDVNDEYLQRLDLMRRDESKMQLEIFTELESTYN
ncbi:MAG: amidophosphoribosyltransferase [Gammaproteobacteria bacterium]|nr:amidophosphoribosyltransferase [Gammaproteobacteria bacterium]